VAVFDGGSYAGDARLPDLQPDQERLLGYAMDLGVEIRDAAQEVKQTVVGLRLEKGTVFTTFRQRIGTTYTIRNRSKHDRSLLLEHPIQKEWTLVDTDKPVEKSKETYRFGWKAPAGKAVRHSISEETLQTTDINIERLDADGLRKLVIQLPAGKAIKDAIEQVIERRARLETASRELARVRGEKSELETEQGRLRTNLDKLPKGSAAHKRTLDKFDQLEIQVDKLQALERQRMEAEQKLRAEYEAFVKGLSVK
jgi:hypothetical protein